MEQKCKQCSAICKPLVKDGRDFFVFNGNSPSFEIYYCNDCKIGFTFPEMTDDELSHYYPGHFEAFVPRKSITGFLQKQKYKSDLKLIQRLVKNCKNPSLFEIGAGRGEFLATARDMGFVVSGIEPGVKGVEFAKQNYGINLQRGYASNVIFNTVYDNIVLRHVLEHINEYDSILKKIFNNGLKKGGILFIKVPRMDSWEAKFFKRYWHGFDLPRHRNHFTKQGIKQLLISLGFTDVVVKNEIVPYDIVRSLNYYSAHGKNKFFCFFSKLILKIPPVLLHVVFYFKGIILQVFGSGRMIVFAIKP